MVLTGAFCSYVRECTKLAQRLLKSKHSNCPIEYIIEILHIIKKVGLMNTLEIFHFTIK
jgi:hypothetical protein